MTVTPPETFRSGFPVSFSYHDIMMFPLDWRRRVAYLLSEDMFVRISPWKTSFRRAFLCAA